jgi:hypothetical protein
LQGSEAWFVEIRHLVALGPLLSLLSCPVVGPHLQGSGCWFVEIRHLVALGWFLFLYLCYLFLLVLECYKVRFCFIYGLVSYPIPFSILSLLLFTSIICLSWIGCLCIEKLGCFIIIFLSWNLIDIFLWKGI